MIIDPNISDKKLISDYLLSKGIEISENDFDIIEVTDIDTASPDPSWSSDVYKKLDPDYTYPIYKSDFTNYNKKLQPNSKLTIRAKDESLIYIGTTKIDYHRLDATNQLSIEHRDFFLNSAKHQRENFGLSHFENEYNLFFIYNKPILEDREHQLDLGKKLLKALQEQVKLKLSGVNITTLELGSGYTKYVNANKHLEYYLKDFNIPTNDNFYYRGNIRLRIMLYHDRHVNYPKLDNIKYQVTGFSLGEKFNNLGPYLDLKDKNVYQVNVNIRNNTTNETKTVSVGIFSFEVKPTDKILSQFVYFVDDNGKPYIRDNGYGSLYFKKDENDRNKSASAIDIINYSKNYPFLYNFNVREITSWLEEFGGDTSTVPQRNENKYIYEVYQVNATAGYDENKAVAYHPLERPSYKNKGTYYYVVSDTSLTTDEIINHIRVKTTLNNSSSLNWRFYWYIDGFDVYPKEKMYFEEIGREMILPMVNGVEVPDNNVKQRTFKIMKYTSPFKDEKIVVSEHTTEPYYQYKNTYGSAYMKADFETGQFYDISYTSADGIRKYSYTPKIIGHDHVLYSFEMIRIPPKSKENKGKNLYQIRANIITNASESEERYQFRRADSITLESPSVLTKEQINSFLNTITFKYHENWSDLKYEMMLPNNLLYGLKRAYDYTEYPRVKTDHYGFSGTVYVTTDRVYQPGYEWWGAGRSWDESFVYQVKGRFFINRGGTTVYVTDELESRYYTIRAGNGAIEMNAFSEASYSYSAKELYISWKYQTFYYGGNTSSITTVERPSRGFRGDNGIYKPYTPLTD